MGMENMVIKVKKINGGKSISSRDLNLGFQGFLKTLSSNFNADSKYWEFIGR